MPDAKKTAINRRNFLRAVTGGSTAAAAVAVLSPGEAHAYDPGDEEAGPLYQETEHVKAFYRVNGYETLKK